MKFPFSKPDQKITLLVIQTNESRNTVSFTNNNNEVMFDTVEVEALWFTYKNLRAFCGKNVTPGSLQLFVLETVEETTVEETTMKKKNPQQNKEEAPTQKKRTRSARFTGIINMIPWVPYYGTRRGKVTVLRQLIASFGIGETGVGKP